MSGEIRSFPIPQDWKSAKDGKGAMDMPIFTKIINVGYNEHQALMVWGIVQDGWKDQVAPYKFQIRKDGDRMEGSDTTSQFIGMVDIDGTNHAVFFGGSTS